VSLAPPSPRLRVVDGGGDAAVEAFDPPRPRRVWPVAVAIIVASALVVSGVAIVAVRRDAPSPAQSAAAPFLHRYLAPDGRVVRHDQGGDTVSEGQAYAMLLTVAAGDRTRFDRTWHWTQRNLERPDGLLSWHWQDGHVVDAMPAADADLDAAWALALAADRFNDADYRQAANHLAGAILSEETASVSGRPLLVAGPWARTSPMYINPGYMATPAMDALSRATGDHIWLSVADQGRRTISALTADDQRLPTDWARVNASGVAWPDMAPNGDAARFGLEAERLVVWQAGSCDAADQQAAQSARALLPAVPAAGDGQGPLAMVAAAAAERAAGHTDQSRSLLDHAAALDARHPTYYGTAWVALGRVLLTTTSLHTCHR
jgi:endo-1,4-beta-D-glucanase Y